VAPPLRKPSSISAPKAASLTPLDKTGVQLILRPGGTKPGRISLDLKDVPLIEALRYCTELAGLTYKVEPYAVTIAATTAEAPAKLEITAKSDAKATVSHAGQQNHPAQRRVPRRHAGRGDRIHPREVPRTRS
jgi:hypothetical protein